MLSQIVISLCLQANPTVCLDRHKMVEWNGLPSTCQMNITLEAQKLLEANPKWVFSKGKCLRQGKREDSL